MLVKVIKLPYRSNIFGTFNTPAAKTVQKPNKTVPYLINIAVLLLIWLLARPLCKRFQTAAVLQCRFPIGCSGQIQISQRLRQTPGCALWLVEPVTRRVFRSDSDIYNTYFIKLVYFCSTNDLKIE